MREAEEAGGAGPGLRHTHYPFPSLLARSLPHAQPSNTVPSTQTHTGTHTASIPTAKSGNNHLNKPKHRGVAEVPGDARGHTNTVARLPTAPCPALAFPFQAVYVTEEDVKLQRNFTGFVPRPRGFGWKAWNTGSY